MNRILGTACLFLLLLVVGCSKEYTVNRSDPIEVSGKVQLASGTALKDVNLALQPTEGNGFPITIKVKSDGTFQEKMIPGKYVFSIQPLDGKDAGKSTASMKNVPDKYKTPNKDNEVEVKGGTLTVTVN